MTSNFEEKRQARIDRLAAAAERKQKEGEARVERAHEMAQAIPFGQPILIGHHSEKSDRAYRGKIEAGFRAGFEMQDEAGRLAERAQAAANNTAIFSDDPSAAEKLEEKIARLEQRQELMKTANKLIKKGDDAGLAELGFSEIRIAQLKQPDYCGRIGFADYEIANNGANIRRCKERLEDLQKKANDQSKEWMIGEIKLVDNVEENRMQIFFPGKPAEPVREELKSRGFHWTPSQGCWQRQRSNAATYYATKIAESAK